MHQPWFDSGVHDDLATPADHAACRAMPRTGSRTFFAASFLLPSAVRDRATALYAFCRLADDAVDVGDDPAVALAQLRERLDQAYGRRPFPHPADRAFADVAARFAIPRTLPEALLEGFQWDAEGRRYETLSDVQAYAARVAGTVGAMMSLLMGARSPEALARACDLGVAMQLTNIARDVGEDARAGRIYLPLGWLREAGIDPERWAERPMFCAELGRIVERVLSAADALYARGEAGIDLLPAGCRRGIFAARMLYAEIGNELRRRGCDSVSARAVTPARRKAALLARALSARRFSGRERAGAPPLDETRFLVEAVAGSPPQIFNAIPWWNVYGRAIWAIVLLDRIEQRAQANRARARWRSAVPEGG